MLRNGRTGHTWHLVVDHIMLVMKMRSSSPVNRLVGLYRGFMCMYKKKNKKKKKKKRQKNKTKSGKLQLAVSSNWRKPAVNGYSPKKKKKKEKKGEKKKSCVNRLLCLLYPLMGSMY